MTKLGTPSGRLSFDQTVSILDGWVGQQVVLLLLLEEPSDSARPYRGELVRHDPVGEMPSTVDPKALAFFRVAEADKQPSNPGGIGLMIYRWLVEAHWTGSRTGLAIYQGSVRTDVLLRDSL